MTAAAFVLYVQAEKQIDRANELRQQSFLLADELRQSSDDLTRMVRTYVATGDAIWKRHYQEILDIREGRSPRPANYQGVYWDLVMPDDARPSPSKDAVPLLTLMRQAGFTGEEFSKLAEAKTKSEPLLQQIFVKRVAKSSDRSVLLAPLARLWIEVIRVKIFGTLGRYDNISNLLNLLDVLRVSGDLGQVSELHVQSAKLRQDA